MVSQSRHGESQVSERAMHFLKVLVERYIRDGQPVGSRTLSKDTGLELSPATIRNVMADLEDLGLVCSPPYLRRAGADGGRLPVLRRLPADGASAVGGDLETAAALCRRDGCELSGGVDVASALRGHPPGRGGDVAAS